MNELIMNLKRGSDAQGVTPEFEEKILKEKRRNGLLTAVAVMLYILCPVPCIVFQDAVKGPVCLFVMAAVATAIIIYKSMTKSKFVKADDTMVENFKEFNQKNDEKTQLFKAISSALWAVILVLYFLVSFATGAWYITWVIFIIGGAAEGIAKAVVDLKK